MQWVYPEKIMSSKKHILSSSTGGLIHGVDYNPDQWLKYPEVIDEDFELFPAAGITGVSLGIFAWSMLEPREGEFDFGWMDGMMDRLHENGLRVMLATPTAGRPPWMGIKYPETRATDRGGKRAITGFRLNMCPSSPVWREKVRIMNTALAGRYAHHPALLMWHVSNEISNECYCEHCRAGFQCWLENRYGNIATLNDAWWTAFWSHNYQDFSEIDALDGSVTGMLVDWKRYQSDLYVDYVSWEISHLRPANPSVPVTTNFVPACRVPEQRRIAALLDVVSWDTYPSWHVGDPMITIGHNAFFNDLYRTMAGDKPMLQMETTASQVNWAADSPLKRPGVHRLTILQCIAHGAEGVCYFQWRVGRSGFEQYHGAVLEHTASARTRVFADVAQAGKDLKELGYLAGQPVAKAEIAILFDWESMWAIENTSLMGNRRKDYEVTCVAHYRAHWRRSFSLDVIGCDDDYTQYRLIVAPMLYLIDEARAAGLREFVASGGTLVLTYLSGMTDLTTRNHMGGAPGPLREVAGIHVEEIDSLSEGRYVNLQAGPDTALDLREFGRCQDYAALIHCEGASVVATYASEFYAGRPAVTRHAFGQGECWFIAGRMEDPALTIFHTALAKRVGVQPLRGDLPDGVTAHRRGTGSDTTNFLMNWTDQPLAGLEAYGSIYQK